VPAVVNDTVSYRDAYKRSQAAIRKLLPDAEKHGIKIAIEEVWNKFLLSPIEFARYIDEFESPWIGAYFDVGNVVEYFDASARLRVLYNNREITNGSELRPSQLVNQPTVHITGLPGSHYTLVSGHTLLTILSIYLIYA
jgi:hypothetical protein